MVTRTHIQGLQQLAIDRFWETFPPIWNQVRNNLRSIATEKFEISVEQFHILRHIRKGLTSVSELAEIRQISRPAISQAVDVLVDKGLVSRQQEAKDRRYVRLELTASGEALLDQIFHENRAWMAAKLASISPEALERIIEGLEDLKTALADAPQPDMK